jgi:hypothetical protein
MSKPKKEGRILDDDLFIELNKLLLASRTEPRAKHDFNALKKEYGVFNRDFNATGNMFVRERGWTREKRRPSKL